MANELITKPIRSALYNLDLLVDINDIISPLAQDPSSMYNTWLTGGVSSDVSNYDAKINELKSKLITDSSDELQTSSNNITTKISSTNSKKKKTAKEKRQEAKEEKENKAKEQLKAFANKQLSAIQEEKDRVVKEYKEKIESIKQNFNNTIDNIKDSYKGDGPGKQKVDTFCDEINENYDQIIETSKKISTEIPMMVSKVPNPGAIGACVTNPGYSVQTMITDLQTILSLFLIIVGCAQAIAKAIENLQVTKIPEVIKSLTNLKLANLIPSLDILNNLINKVKDMNDKINTQRDAINEAQKQMKNSVEQLKQPIYSEDHEGDKDYIVAYKSVVLFDDLTLKGYNFYFSTSKKSGNANILAYNQAQKNIKITNFLQKNGFKSVSDISGRAYGEYMGILNSSSKKIKNYDFWYFLPSNNINDNTVPSVDNELTTASIENDKPNIELSGTIITLESGKKILLDGKYSSGDVVKLTDGTIVTIK